MMIIVRHYCELFQHYHKEVAVIENRYKVMLANVFKIISSLLACESFNGSHSGLNIAQKLHSILEKNGIRNKTR